MDRVKIPEGDLICTHCGHTTPQREWASTNAKAWDPKTRGRGWQVHNLTGLCFCCDACADNAKIAYA